MPFGIGIWHADVSNEHSDEDNARSLRDVGIAKRIGETLERHYKGHHPRIEVDSRGGIARLYHPLLPPTWGYTIKLSDFNADPGMKCVIRGFGELLERFNQPRTHTTRDNFRDAMAKYRHISRGRFPLEFNMKTGQVRRHMPEELAR